ncbi:trace amine-associated receptor 1-like [Lepisosteus oculatus]|uniref:trace amine-associated receptor 1-like n=1 Tax=Lepisosteus oculatus TaxID=7918 RepID=UPI0035F514AF
MNFSQTGMTADTQFCYDSVNKSCLRHVYLTAIRAPMYLFFGVTIIFTICGNLFVIVSIAHFKQLHTPTNFLVLSLAVVDLLLGGFIMPPSMVRSLETCWYYGDLFCKIHESVGVMLCTASILHLSFISIDRYFAVCEPLKYKTKINVYVAFNMITVSWSISAVTGFGMIFLELNIMGMEDVYYETFYCIGGCALIQSEASSMISSTLSFYIPGFIMIGIYLKIFLVARRQARTIQGIVSQSKTSQDSRKTTSSKTERKAAKTLGIVMGVFLCCWMPFFLCNTVNAIFNYSVPAVLLDSLVWLGYLNSTFNPLVYAFFYSWFRKALVMIVFGKIFQTDSSRTKLITD